MKIANIPQVIGSITILLFLVSGISIANACGSSESSEGSKTQFMQNGEVMAYSFVKVKCPPKAKSDDNSKKEGNSAKAQDKKPSLNKSVSI